MATRKTLDGIGKKISAKAENHRKIPVETIVEEVETSGFGPMLLVPALIIILPTGAIPGVPDACNIIIVLMAAQLVFGRSTPWLPQWLTRLKISGPKVDKAMQKASPVLRKIDGWSRQRFTSLTGRTAQRCIAGLIMMTSALSIGIGVIPYVPALLALPTLFFAFGMTLRDGLIILLGLVLLTCTAGATYALS